jgi:hypothetical protein
LLFHHFGLRELVCDISHKEHFEMQAEQGEHGHFDDPGEMLFLCLLFGHGFSVLRLDMLHSVLDASKGPVVQTFTFRSAFTDPSSTPCASVTLFFVITSSLFS